MKIQGVQIFVLSVGAKQLIEDLLLINAVFIYDDAFFFK